MTFSLALDLGASYLKASRVDATGRLCGPVLRRPAPIGIPEDGEGSRVIDADALLRATRDVIEEASAGEVPRSIAIANQMHGFVLAGPKLDPVMGPVTWQDRRGAPHVDALRATLGPELVRRLGNELRGGIPIATMAALRGRLPDEGVKLASIGDWVAWNLIGEVGPVHTTNAAAMGLYDVIARAWSPDACAAVGLPEDALPEVTTGIEVIGVTSDGSSVLVPVGDQQAALFGVGLGPDEMSFNAATGAQVTRIGEGLAEAVQTRPYVDGRLLHTVTHIPAGRALNAWLGLLSEIGAPDAALADRWDDVLIAVKSAPDTSLSFNLAMFDSAEGSSGSVLGVEEDALAVGPFFRAALDALAASLVRHAGRVGYAGINDAVLSGGWLREGRCVEEMLRPRLPVAARLADRGEDVLWGLGRFIADS